MREGKAIKIARAIAVREAKRILNKHAKALLCYCAAVNGGSPECNKGCIVLKKQKRIRLVARLL